MEISERASAATDAAAAAEAAAYASFLPLRLRVFHQRAETALGAGALAVNIVFLALLFTERNPLLRNYAFVLTLNALTDVGFALVALYTEYQMEFTDGYFFSLVAVHRSGYAQIFLFIFFCAFANFLPPLVFVHRYYVIVRGAPLRKRALLTLYGVVATVSLHQAASSTFGFYSGEAERGANCARLFANPFWRQGDAPICFCTQRYDKWMMYCMVSAICIVLATNCIMIYTTVTIFRRLKYSMQDITEKTRKLQTQMNTMLIVQIILPLFFEFLPINVMALFAMLGVRLPGMGILVLMAMSAIPFISPLTTILLVAPFRARVVRVANALVRFKLPQETPPTTQQKPTTNNLFPTSAQFI